MLKSCEDGEKDTRFDKLLPTKHDLLTNIIYNIVSFLNTYKMTPASNNLQLRQNKQEKNVVYLFYVYFLINFRLLKSSQSHASVH